MNVVVVNLVEVKDIDWEAWKFLFKYSNAELDL